MAKRTKAGHDETISERSLPHSLEAERAVLGALLVNTAAMEKAASWLRRGRVFYRQAHRTIYAAMLTVVEERRAALDLLTLKDELVRLGQLDECGGVAYISALTDGVPRSSNVAHYARIVYEDAVRREVIKVSGRMLADAYDGELSSNDVVMRADAALVDLQRTRLADRLVDLRKDLGPLYESVEWHMANQGKLTGVPSGFATVDELTAGWQAGDMIVIGARPSMGKTALMLNMVIAAAKAGKTGLVFSLEMRRRQLEYRMLSTLAGVPLSRIIGGWLNEDEMARLSEAFTAMATLPIFVDDRSGQTIHDIRATCRQVRAESGLDLVVIDYAGLVTGSLDHKRNATRREELEDISRRVKLLADELGVPVFLLSQLKRGDGRKPRLEDLRETGAFEQDADIVAFIHRKHHLQSGRSLFMIEKQRNGPAGVVQLTFERDIQTFADAGPDVTSADAEPEPEPERKPRRVGRKPKPYSAVDAG
jgi:replicative DNA helicase